MIDRFRSISVAGKRFKPFVVFVGIVAITIFVLEVLGIIGTPGDDFLLIPSMVLSLWAIVLWAILHSFPNVPERLDKSARFFKRIKSKMVRLSYYLLAILFVATTVMLIWLSSKLLVMWYGEIS